MYIVPEPPEITGVQASYDANGLTELVVKYRESVKVNYSNSSPKYFYRGGGRLFIDYNPHLILTYRTSFTSQET
jgi:hypothetical protein